MVVTGRPARLRIALFKDVGSFFKEKDLLVLNDTKVLHCRLMGNKTTEAGLRFYSPALNGSTFSCLGSASRTKIGERLFSEAERLSGFERPGGKSALAA